MSTRYTITEKSKEFKNRLELLRQEQRTLKIDRLLNRIAKRNKPNNKK